MSQVQDDLMENRQGVARGPKVRADRLSPARGVLGGILLGVAIYGSALIIRVVVLSWMDIF